ncbi:unnamed protein product [Microthlaspi erraticum]|uniref:Reverse transcriptase domain-containing protein n=1 Tax=Microthlaspi erraticum TaxID=1685480 RepID=A0A6D2HUW9_9BRAS|nr:unnamed protein product [Microthlaspi erraticum]
MATASPISNLLFLLLRFIRLMYFLLARYGIDFTFYYHHHSSSSPSSSLIFHHSALYLQLEPKGHGDARRRPFRFEAAWLTHPSFKELLIASWDPAIDTRRALNKLEAVLRKWNREVFGDVQKQREAEMLKEFDTVREQEELIWAQKARETWIAHGDRNTTFFHTSTIIRRRRNRIEMLKNDEGTWLSDKSELEGLAVEYYRRLYSMEDVDQVVEPLPGEGFVDLSQEDVRALSNPFSEDEIVTAVRSMGSLKAPGPDGYQPMFYQKCWTEVGESVTRFVLDFFRTGLLPQGTNDVILVLLAKVAGPEKIQQFRPISLCNVIFKLITKVMVSRMKPIMTKLIGPAQSSFIPGRLSTDNIIIVQEAVHSMRRKKGKRGWMLLKLDLEKAYNRIRWDFLEDSLRAAGFSEQWVAWIMQCVSGPSMCELWNGEKTSSFKPSRGLRQGDPLSPYLFVLCMERLCHLIEMAIDEKRWKPISLSRGGPKLSHICFADDLILFAEASVAQIRVVRGVLERFCRASGQKVSLEKSKIFFSDNVSRELRSAISVESGIQSTRELGRYLGMPILQKRINKETFGTVVERVSSKLAGWKGRVLSMAGHITLSKSVLGSIPVHSMSSCKLPEATLNSLERLSRDFIWGSTAEKRKQHLLGWDKWDGESFRTSLVFGLEFFVVSIVLGIFMTLPGWSPKGPWSSTWRSVALGIRDVIVPGHSWAMGDGRSIAFWTDKWLMGKALCESPHTDIPGEMMLLKARDLWINGTGWDMQRILPYVTEETRLELAAVVVNTVTERRDSLSWSMVTDGSFTVSSAYRLLTCDVAHKPDMSLFFKRIWRVRAPERVRSFLWLVGNYGIMTNEERSRRHMGDTAICQVCKAGVESITHVLRDCPAIAGIMTRIVPRGKQQIFFALPLMEWLFENLGENAETGFGPWSTMFAIVTWWAWKWRCGNIFGDGKLWRDRVKFVKEYAKEMSRVLSKCGGGTNVNRAERLISWTPPLVSWVKLNTDEASRGNPGLASAGGVLRNGEGQWCGGFALNIGRCTAPMAELWGVYYGLCIAWEKGITRLELEVDSLIVVGFLKTGMTDSHPLSFLVHLCHGFISKDWEVRVTHVLREANRLADGLANYAFSLPLGLHFLDSVPSDLLVVLSDDERGVSRSRQVVV